ncbi:MAG: cohesin domain-containing protein [Candidatus Woesearchaeota archaeon]
MKLARYLPSKKATDKPIEIFVALFIVLAVAMVILQMFSGQISAKAKELKSIEQANALKREVAEAKQLCQEKCTNTLENDCSDMMRAQFCITYVAGGLDLNGNGIMNDYDHDFLGGVGVCEDRIYCPQIVNCICKQELTTRNCIQILCTYWKSQGVGTADLDLAMAKYVSPGTCNYTNKPQHWANLGMISCSGGGTIAPTCQNQGYQCCASCQSGAQPQYNSNCGSQVCCTTCTTQAGCSNDCTTGAKECVSSTSYRTCGNYDADSCTEWSTAANCPSGQTCSNGACATSCTNECTSGQKQCSGANAYQTCGNYDADSCTEWSTATNCPTGQTCSSGNCAAAGTYTLTLVPSSPSISQGSQFTVSININNINNLQGAELSVNFDSARMQYVSSAAGNFMDFCVAPTVVGGTLTNIGCVSTSGSRTGTGTIVTITFTATSPGSASFSLSNVLVMDANNQQIPGVTSGTASITIS